MYLDHQLLDADDKPVRLRRPIVDHYVSIPEPTADNPTRRVSYHIRTNISKHDFTTKRFFKTAAQTYSFIRRNGHGITECSTYRGCPGRIG